MKKLEDSKDLTDAMIEQALAKSENEAILALEKCFCTCKGLMRIKAVALRRRTPQYYWVATMLCDKCESVRRIIFKLTDQKWQVAPDVQ